jgi:cytochrome c oxidase accessory protein FixG
MILKEEKNGVTPKKNKDNPEIGDCIDCHQCVNVCPTGIDIRNGTQLECIGCTACIDACDGIMDRIGKPRGLVRYASVENIEQKKKFKFNVRIVAYSIVLGIIIIIISILLITRQPVKVEALRVPGTTYQTRPDGKISNLYQVKFSSRMFHDFTPELRLVQPTGELEIIGSAPLVKAGDVTQLTMIVLLDKDQIHGLKEKATIGIFNENEKITEMKITFFGPVDKINKP